MVMSIIKLQRKVRQRKSLKNVVVDVEDGDAFSLCLASNNSTDLSDMELTYWIHDENRFPISSMCRGSMEWYDTLYEAYNTSQ